MTTSISLETTAAKADFERALALAPENVVLNFYGDFLEITADVQHKEELKRKAVAFNSLAFARPMNFEQHSRLSTAL